MDASQQSSSQSPQPAAQATLPTNPQAKASISGKVVDQSGTSIAGAKVSLTLGNSSISQGAVTDNNGQFTFADLSPGPYHLEISSAGLTPQSFDGTLTPGEAYAMPLVMLTVAVQETTVRVGITPVQQASMEVQDEEKQRLFGVIPNFFVTYAKHPAPLTTKMKFQLAWRSSIDPFTLLSVGAVAGGEQAVNQWAGYGQGAQGYAKRFGATYADVFVGTYLGGAVIPSLLKQDPRYYYRGRGSTRSRFLHALTSTIICPGDNGHLQPNYSNILGAAAAGGVSTLYAPSNGRSAANIVLTTTLIRIGETAVADMFQEFLIPKLTPNFKDPSTLASQQ
ncbi:MAG TPA: carboxypeptidase-like regulatory domain-containing protein [Candidatus Acidoferrum sp.]|nr:carboxypeptidase-like regulatory domain-containing protein [Candidatus Acidoferrum sp.]